MRLSSCCDTGGAAGAIRGEGAADQRRAVGVNAAHPRAHQGHAALILYLRRPGIHAGAQLKVMNAAGARMMTCVATAGFPAWVQLGRAEEASRERQTRPDLAAHKQKGDFA